MAMPVWTPEGAPRNPRWTACVRNRWPLGVLGLGFLAGLVVLATLLRGRGQDLLPLADDALDARAAWTPGEVLGVMRRDPEGSLVRYRFTPPGVDAEPEEGLGIVQGAPPRTGAEVGVQYLRDDPSIHRLAGSRRHGGRGINLVVTVLLLGPLALFFWMRAISYTRMVLRDGLATGAEILQIDPVPAVQPPQDKVRYAFVDASGTRHEDEHWVGRRSPIRGELTLGGRSAVVYDPHRPAQHSRLVHAGDFHPA